MARKQVARGRRAGSQKETKEAAQRREQRCRHLLPEVRKRIPREADEGVRRRYDETKRRLAATHPHDRRAYGAGKEELIEGVLRGRS